MSKDEGGALQRYDGDKLPAGFEQLPPEERQELIKRLAEQDLELRREAQEKLTKSRIAEHDVAVTIDGLQRLDHERKIYTEHVKGETGSGTYDLKVKGGDIRFIVPVLVVLGVFLLALVVILALL